MTGQCRKKVRERDRKWEKPKNHLTNGQFLLDLDQSFQNIFQFFDRQRIEGEKERENEHLTTA